MFGTADVEVFPDDFFKEDAAAYGPIQNLSEGEFDLENGELIAIAGLTVFGGEGMGQTPQPFAKQGIDLCFGEPVTEDL